MNTWFEYILDVKLDWGFVEESPLTLLSSCPKMLTFVKRGIGQLHRPTLPFYEKTEKKTNMNRSYIYGLGVGLCHLGQGENVMEDKCDRQGLVSVGWLQRREKSDTKLP